MNNLCECGCGKLVLKKGNRYISGHNTKGSKQSNFTIEKRKKTMLKKYGVEHSQQSEQLREKSKKTLLLNYGVEHPCQSEIIKQKCMETCIRNYQVDNPSKNEHIQNKKKITNIQKYGVESSNQNILIKEKKKETCQKHYGVDTWSQTEEGKLFLRRMMIKKIYKQYGNITVIIGKNENNFFDKLRKNISFQIIRPSKPMFGYFPDGIIPELKIILEFDEKHHSYLYQIKHDNERDSFFRKKGYITYRIKEKNWLKNSDLEIKKLKILLSRVSLKKLENEKEQIKKIYR